MDSSDSNKYTKEEMTITTTLVSNGCVDYKGRIADKQKTGGWKAAPYIIVNEVAERFAFFSIAVNMVAYLGMVLLTVSGSIDTLRPPHCTKKPCIPASPAQTTFLYFALALIALGTGGIKPCVSSFGADQFDESDPDEAQKKYSFFNWFFFAINMGALFGITLLVYVQVELGWAWGFGIPTCATIISIFILAAGWRKYRYQKPMGSAFTRFVQVIVASGRNHLRGVEVSRDDCRLYEVDSKESDIRGARKLAHTQQYRYLDKAAVITDPDINPNNRWKLCTITQVEEFKSFIRIIPIWASTIALAISFSQLSTFFIAQANTMDRSLGPNFRIPPGSIPVFSSVNALIVVPIYEKIVVPFLRPRTGHPRGITSLQRMGTGLFVSIVAMVSAAMVEKKRREDGGLISVFWLFPQCFLIGTARFSRTWGSWSFSTTRRRMGRGALAAPCF
ncbi:hypothetical protein DH2020_007561 [Rehmannia glutinosa]|uniref:Uncharacterized protein n=1 Tax=Rehmannia glutinosa TaxID=99300 RepID=A0ABR0TYR4_REHGL